MHKNTSQEIIVTFKYMWAKKDEYEVVYWLICIKKVLSPKNRPRSLVLRYACKASRCRFWITHFFLQFVNSQIIFVLFCNDIVNLRDCLAGIFYEALWSKYFHNVLCSKKRLCVGIANCDYISGIVVGISFFLYASSN